LNQQRNNIKLEIDWLLVILYLALISFGWMNIYSASSSAEHNEIFDFGTRYGKQIIWIGLGLFVATFLLFIESAFYEKFAAYLYLATMLLLVGLFIIGKT